MVTDKENKISIYDIANLSTGAHATALIGTVSALKQINGLVSAEDSMA